MSFLLSDSLVTQSKKHFFKRTPNIILIVGLGLLLLVYGSQWWGRPGIQSLESVALNNSDSTKQQHASLQLVDIGEEAKPSLRRILRESENAGVVSICMNALSRMQDDQSVDVFFSKLDDNSLEVRQSASKAITNMLGRDHHFPATDSVEKRQKAKQRMQADWEMYQGSELHEFNKKRFKENNYE